MGYEEISLYGNLRSKSGLRMICKSIYLSQLTDVLCVLVDKFVKVYSLL